MASRAPASLALRTPGEVPPVRPPGSSHGGFEGGPWGKTYGKFQKAHAQRRAAEVTAEGVTPRTGQNPGGQGRGGEPTTVTPSEAGVALLAPL